MSGTIKDSGQRTEFSSGAVRDMQGEDKGRCDLMPLDVVSHLFFVDAPLSESVLDNLAYYRMENEAEYLYCALVRFIDEAFDRNRETAMLELSVHFRDGAEKYGENNWQKGLPEWSYISSAVRHYLKWRRGDQDERHDRAFMWNMVCLIWTVENGVNDEKVMADVVAETKQAFGRFDEDWGEGE